MSEALSQIIRHRADFRCEYCHLPESCSDLRHVLDHIVARQHAGGDTEDNLALCCVRCNLHKGPNVAGVDAETGQVVPLFNPRREIWTDHFQWNGAVLLGLSVTGSVTIQVLAINQPIRITIRQALISEGIQLS